MPRKADLDRMQRGELIRLGKETFPDIDGRSWFYVKLDTIREAIRQHDLSIAFPDGPPDKSQLGSRPRKDQSPKRQVSRDGYLDLAAAEVLERLIIRLGRQQLTQALLETDDERIVEAIRHSREG